MPGLRAWAFMDKKRAEIAFKDQCFKSALLFADNAKLLHNQLDGIEDLIQALKVINSAETETDDEEVDRYKVLHVDINADHRTIRNSFKKLAYCVHPDRNKSVAALTAFKILSEAWSLLSDKETRIMYDERRRKKQKAEALVLVKASKLGGGETGSHYVIKGKSSNRKVKARSTPSQIFLTGPTFWTLCNHCRIEFEYEKAYLNKHLKCYKCRKNFLAIKIISPSQLSGGDSVPSNQFQQKNYGLKVLGSHSVTQNSPSVVNNRWDWKKKYTKGSGSNAQGVSSAVRLPERSVTQKRKWQGSDQMKPIPKKAKKELVFVDLVSDSETESDSPVPFSNQRKVAAREARNI